MQVRIEEVSAVEKKLVVEVPWEEVSNRLGKAYRDLAKTVQLKGFRKGKVPRSVLQRRFGKHVRAEVADQLVRESFISAATEHKLEAVSEPRIEDELSIQKGEPFAFEAIIEVRGEVDVTDYDGMELTKRPLNVPDEAVERTLEQLRKEHMELLPIEGRDVTASTDVITLKVQGSLGENEIDRPRLSVDLEESAQEPLPGMVEALIGLPINVEDHAIELTIPDDYMDNSIAGQTAKLVVSITDARLKKMPELDDDFAKDTGKGDTIDELRAGIREQLEERQTEEIKSELRDAALKELVTRNQIPVASALVDRAVEFQFQRLKMMLGIPDIPEDPNHVHDENCDHDHGIPGLTPDMREKMRPQAVDEVRGQLLLDALAKQEEVDVDNEAIDEHVGKLAAMHGKPTARYRAELDRDGKLDSIVFQLRQDKALDLLIERATVTEVEPSDEPEEEAAAEAAEGAEAPEAAEDASEPEAADDDSEGDSSSDSDE
jgi:trigger factor